MLHVQQECVPLLDEDALLFSLPLGPLPSDLDETYKPVPEKSVTDSVTFQMCPIFIYLFDALNRRRCCCERLFVIPALSDRAVLFHPSVQMLPRSVWVRQRRPVTLTHDSGAS